MNQQNFSSQDLLGVSGGGQGGGPGQMPANFLIGQQAGISSVNSIGTNYADSLGSRAFLTGSYFFNRTDNSNPQDLTRKYGQTGDSVSLYRESSDAEQEK